MTLHLRLISLLILLSPLSLLAQGVRHVNIAQGSVTLAGSSGFSGAVARILSGASVTVCNGSTLPPVGNVCTGLATIYSDIALTQTLSNPISADTNGNYSFYATGGVPYVVSVSFIGFTTYSYVWSAPVSYSGTGIVANATNLVGPGTVTGNYTSSGTWTQSGPIVNTGTDSGTQTISGTKTFTGPTTFNNNTSVGTGSAAFFFIAAGSTQEFGEGAAPTASANNDLCSGVSATHTLQCTYNNGTAFSMTQTIASGTATMSTTALGAAGCETVVTVSASGVTTTDTITWAFSADPGTTTGYSTGIIDIYVYPTANNVNFRLCASAAVTPGAATLNWRVVR